jgi:hypothetical protein
MSDEESEKQFFENARHSLAMHRSDQNIAAGETDVEMWSKHRGRIKTHSNSQTHLNGKWIFIRGDSTMRVVVASLFGSLLNMTEEELKDFARTSDKCFRPEHAPDYKSFLESHPEYGNWPCYLNEKICHFHLPNQFNLTYDWQHFIFEGRERYLFDTQAARTDPKHDFHHGMPKSLVIGLPIHPCIHTNPKGKLEKYPLDQPELEKNYTSQLGEYLEAVRSVFHGPVFWVEAGGYTRFGSRQQYHTCLDSMNTELARVILSDKHSFLVKRADLEKEWVRNNDAIATDAHKPPEINRRIGARLWMAMAQSRLVF